MNMEPKTKSKQQILDEFAVYAKNNPGVSYAEAAKAMHRTSRTIHNWCKELGIKLTTSRTRRASYQSITMLPSIAEEEEDQAMLELDRAAEEVKKGKLRTQKRIDELRKRIFELRIAEYDQRIAELEDELRRRWGRV